VQGFLNGGWGQVIVILIGIALGVLYNNARIADLKNYVDAKFGGTDKQFEGLKDSYALKSGGWRIAWNGWNALSTGPEGWFRHNGGCDRPTRSEFMRELLSEPPRG